MSNGIPSPLRAAAISALLALAAAFVAPFASAQGAGYWHTSGNKVLDSNGTEVRIAGINWYGFETPDYLVHGLWAEDYTTVLNNIKSLGFNVIRIPFSNQMVESDPVPSNYTQYANGGAVNQALVGATALQDLDTIVAYAGSIGLRVILDNHRSEAGESNEANGLWYTSAYPQSNWIADWQTMATRYSASKFTFNGNPTVIGMDLRNEPHLIGSSSTSGSCWTGDTVTNGCPSSLTSQNWPVAATTAGNAILAINPHLLIFVEGNDCYSGTCGWQGGNLIGVATNPVTLSVANQLVYSAHDYGPSLYQQPWFNSSTTPASLDAVWNKYWGYISANGTAPVWLGEFGTDNSSSDIENSAAGSQGQWFESLVSYLQSNPQLNWTYWALNGEDSYGLLDGNYDATPPSTLKLSELQSIQFPLGGGTTSGFTLKASSSTLSVAQGSTGTDTITIADSGSFTGNVTFAASGMPTGVTASFSPASSTTSSVLSFSVASTTVAGSYPITITGTSGSLTASTSITLTVTSTSTGSFTLKASTSTLSVAQGASGTDTITVSDVSPFSGSVSFAASGMPSGVTASFSPDSSATSSVVTLSVASTATAGSYPITITGTSGSLTSSTSITLTVTSTSTGSFTLKASTSTLSVAQGASGTDTITVSDVSPFSGSVSFAASGMPSGVTASFSPASSATSSVVTLSVASTATAGSYPITITGTSGSLTASTSITLTVTSTSGNYCHVAYSISSQWPGGFGAAITIENTGTANWTSWTLTWTFANGQTITQLWNGNETQSGANVTISSLSYNGSIPAGGSYNGMGFNGSWNSTTNSVPTAFAINGTTCH